MKKTILLVLCFFLMAASVQAGAGGKSGKQKNPKQAGKSPIYFYDVEATDTHGFGQLVINVDKHTFVFIGKDFLPSALIGLRAITEGSPENFVFAQGKATPSGKLHIAGTWEADDPPTDVLLITGRLMADDPPATVLDPPEIWGFWLENNGLFSVKIAFRYSEDDGETWTLSDNTSDAIGYGEDKQSPYYIHDVPSNVLLKIKAEVVWGDDKSGSEVFEAVADSGCWAYYETDGTTQNVSLSYIGRYCFE